MSIGSNQLLQLYTVLILDSISRSLQDGRNTELLFAEAAANPDDLLSPPNNPHWSYATACSFIAMFEHRGAILLLKTVRYTQEFDRSEIQSFIVFSRRCCQFYEKRVLRTKKCEF